MPVNKASFQFWFDEKFYTVQGAETMFRMGTKDDLSTMRSEYTRMRDVAQKRLQRLSKAFPDSRAVKDHPKGFPKLKSIDPRDFPKAFSELAKFVKAKGSTVSGQREIKKKTIDTWNRQGIPLNEANYDRTIKILEEMRRRKIVYGSDTAEEVARLTLGLSKEQFDDVLDHLEEYLTHTEELADFMKSSYDAKTGYQLVNMNDFRHLIGW